MVELRLPGELYVLIISEGVSIFLFQPNHSALHRFDLLKNALRYAANAGHLEDLAVRVLRPGVGGYCLLVIVRPDPGHHREHRVVLGRSPVV